MKDGQLRVWWIPQVPMKKSFYVEVDTLHEAKLIMDTLGLYDEFQLKHRIKRDYSNAGGLEKWCEEDGWGDWYDSETGMDFDEYCEEYPV